MPDEAGDVLKASFAAAKQEQSSYRQRNAHRFIRSATRLSAHYKALAGEILGHFVARSQQTAPA